MPLRETLTQLAAPLPIARMVVNDELFLQLAPPVIRFDDIAVTPPPKAFFQATWQSEQAMVAKALALLPEKKINIADLFSGLGTFSLPLARVHEITAVENDHSLLAALQQGANGASGLKPLQILERDLFKMPLSDLELRPFDAVIFDPPRAGARSQAQMLACSSVPQILAVSCNPQSFAGDARLLLEGGYSLKSLTPFDQFLYSPHVELIGAFVK
jgi:23S rRNA (uracil1939-C5)-methyltransferase